MLCFTILPVNFDGVVVVDVSVVADLDGEVAGPAGSHFADAVIGVVRILVDFVSILIVEVDVEVGVTVSIDNDGVVLSAEEGDLPEVVVVCKDVVGVVDDVVDGVRRGGVAVGRSVGSGSGSVETEGEDRGGGEGLEEGVDGFHDV